MTSLSFRIKYIITILLGSILQLCVNQTIAENDAEELVRNAGIEESSPSGGAAGWTFDHWAQDELGNTATRDENIFHSGSASLKITLVNGDDGKLIQDIQVKPNTWYRFSAWVKTQGIPEDALVGANLSIIDAMEYSSDLKGDNDWQKMIAWGNTGADQTHIKIAVRVGFFGGLTRGTAWFDDISLIQNEPPADGKIISFLPPPPSESNDSTKEQNSGGFLTSLIALIIPLGFLLLAWWAIREHATIDKHFGVIRNWLLPHIQPEPSHNPEYSHNKGLLVSFILVVLFLKIIAAALFTGYPADIGTFSAWALDVYDRGFSGFYMPNYFADYPPGYITILWPVGAISNWFHIGYGSAGFLLLLKTPALLADIGGAIFLLAIARKNSTLNSRTLLIAFLWLINPLVIITSSFWGQVDSIFTLVMAASLLLLEGRRVIIAAALYAIAVLLKPQALLISPIALIALLSLRNIPLQIKTIVAFVATFILLSLPFTLFHEPTWIFSLYGSTLSSYNYLTLNAFNLYALLGQNWVPNETLVYGLQVSTWSWILTLALLASVLFALTINEYKTASAGRYLFTAFILFLLFFVVGPKMHERYLFPAALIGFTSFAVIGDRRVLWLAIGVSLTTFINTLVTLDLMLRLQSSLVPNSNPFLLIGSLANVALLITSLWVGYDIFVRGNLRPLADKKLTSDARDEIDTTRLTTAAIEKPLEKPTRKTWLSLAAICTVYSIAAFTYLGDFKSPQTFWDPSAGGDWAIFDLHKIESIKQLNYHHGLGEGEYAFALSTDDKDWSPQKSILVDNRFAQFRWRAIDVNQPAQYLKIRLSSGALQMNELAIRNQQGELIMPTQIAGPKDAGVLFDEQNTFVEPVTSLNSMYFDEIYHARSAWEIIQGINASENTHPPLGKIIIGAGIKLFGMNGFGFRFMGTLFGILMLPVLFFLARRLFQSDYFALIATAFFAVDFMHFTQTRIATIDTYGVFFILASAYWMLRFMQSEPARHHWKTDTTSLFWCGVFFGLGAASKWTVLYHAFGLALLYCWMLWQQMQIAKLQSGSLTQGYGGWAARTMLISIIAFIIIPALIYSAAYIPLMKTSGQGFAGMLENQTSMWSYHSTMKSTHPASSPWYSWPVMNLPIWYYDGSEWTQSNKASTIIGFGNPVVWYLGSIAFLIMIGWRYLLANSTTLEKRFEHSDRQKLALGFILIAGLAQFLPWAIIPRKLVFIYHFFTSVPFIILALVWGLQQLHIYNPTRIWIKYLPWVLVAFAALLFIAYFPAISGLPVSRTWLEFIKRGPVDIYF